MMYRSLIGYVRLTCKPNKYIRCLSSQAGRINTRNNQNKVVSNSLAFNTDKKVNLDVIKGGSIELNAALCSGCGTPFQSSYPSSPGYLTKDKFREHQKRTESRKQIKDALKVLNTASIDITSSVAYEVLKEAGVPEQIIYKLQNKAMHENTGHTRPISSESVEEGSNANTEDSISNIRPQEAATPVEVFELSDVQSDMKSEVDDNIVHICQRCYKLKQYGELQPTLRPGWSDNALLAPEKFDEVLSIAKDSSAVILCLVDVFDLTGSMLTNLKSIAGNNPIVIGANKVDLLPSNVPTDRLVSWIYSELKTQCGLMSAKEKQQEIFEFKRDNLNSKGWFESNFEQKKLHAVVLKRENIHLISCASGKGIKSLLNEVIDLSRGFNNTVYVLGAANVGKSSFINHIIDTSDVKEKMGKRISGSKKSVMSKYKSLTASPQSTVSNIPGTTLDCIRINLPKENVTFIDTPGVINQQQLTTVATNDELKCVIPQREIKRITHRLQEGKVVLLGGYGRVQLLEVSYVLAIVSLFSIDCVLFLC